MPSLPNTRLATCFVYVIYGQQQRHYLEAQLSIASLLRHNPSANVCVLAECYEYFSPHTQLHIVPLTLEMKNQWLGTQGYHFQLKLAGLKYVLSHIAEKAIFLDTDTLIRKPLQALFDDIDEQATLLHEKEGMLSKRRFARQYQTVLGETFEHSEFGTWPVTSDLPMYNSGLIGISRAHIKLLDIALWLMVKIDDRIAFHTAEQFALGIILSRFTTVGTVGHRAVYHYWHKQPRAYIFEQLEGLLASSSEAALYLSPQVLEHFSFRRPLRRWWQDKMNRKARPLAKV